MPLKTNENFVTFEDELRKNLDALYQRTKGTEPYEVLSLVSDIEKTISEEEKLVPGYVLPGVFKEQLIKVVQTTEKNHALGVAQELMEKGRYSTARHRLKEAYVLSNSVREKIGTIVPKYVASLFHLNL